MRPSDGVRHHPPGLAPICALLWGLLLAGCGGDGVTGPGAEPCGPGPHFTALPVALGDIDAITVFGGLGAPGHTLPTAHPGFYLATEGAAVQSPGTIQIYEIRRSRYLVSPSRQGETDYTVSFRVCREITGWFGHLVTLSSLVPVPESDWKQCRTHSTADETVESCSATRDNVRLDAGQPLGTGGLSLALGLMGLDFGLLDSRVDNFYVSRWRHPPATFRAICPWEQFEPGLRNTLFGKLADKGRPTVIPAGEPRCGTMTVDVAGTAKGVWALPSETQPLAGNETNYITLANYPYRPEDHLALSLAPASLGAAVAVVPREQTGRVNRAFEQVTNDGLIYCYGFDIYQPTVSWLLQLTGPSALSIRRMAHAIGASPCLADPSTWSLTGALAMVR